MAKMMPAPPKDQAAQVTNGIKEEDPVQGVLSFLKDLGSSDAIRKLRSIQTENAALHGDVDRLQTAYTQNLIQLKEEMKTADEKRESHELELEKIRLAHEQELEKRQKKQDQDSKSLQTARDTIKKKEEELQRVSKENQGYTINIEELIKANKKKEATINKLDSEYSRLNNEADSMTSERVVLQKKNEELQNALQGRDRELQEVKAELVSIKTHLLDLTPLNSRRHDIYKVFEDLLGSAHRLMNEMLGQDLEPTVLQEKGTWKSIREHHAIQYSFPVPSSNSVAAKTMRVAAGLIIYGTSLKSNVLRATYSDLDEELAPLESKSALHEQLARAMILKILPERPKRRQDAGVKRMLEDVENTLLEVVPGPQREEFKDRLRRITLTACQGWGLVQTLEERVTISFDEAGLEDCEALSLVRATSHGSAHSPSSAPPQDQTTRQTQQTQPSQAADFHPENLAKVVWPAILASDATDPEGQLLCHGLALTQEDLSAAARDEEGAASARAERMKKRHSEQNGGQRARKDSGISFLSPGADGSARGEGE